MANLARLAEQPDLPAPLRAAVRTVMALQARPEALTTPQGLKQALAVSGLFLEARLARPQPAGVPPRPTSDLKAALVKLQQVVADLAPQAPDRPAAANPPPSGRAAHAPAPPPEPRAAPPAPAQ
ncbi:hypothetical protein ACFODL_19750, partial [Phenylobacterium terrae]